MVADVLVALDGPEGEIVYRDGYDCAVEETVAFLDKYDDAHDVDQVVTGSHRRMDGSRVPLGSVRKSGGFSSQSERNAF